MDIRCHVGDIPCIGLTQPELSEFKECQHFWIVNQPVSIIDQNVPSASQQLFYILQRYMTTCHLHDTSVCHVVDRHAGDKFSLKAELIV